jgi:hypothetical protein
MKNLILQIYRKKQNEKQTTGLLFIDNKIKIYSEIGYMIEYQTEFCCHTLELPDKNNQPFISRINAGIYQVEKRWSLKHKWHFIIRDVEDRTWILIHAMKFYFNTTGCIGVGDGLTDINNDGLRDLTNSRKTLDKMLEILPETFELRIYDEVKNDNKKL